MHVPFIKLSKVEKALLLVFLFLIFSLGLFLYQTQYLEKTDRFSDDIPIRPTPTQKQPKPTKVPTSTPRPTPSPTPISSSEDRTVEYSTRNATITFINELGDRVIDANFSNPQMFDFSMSSDKRYAITSKLSDSDENDWEIIVYDYSTQSFLEITNEVTEAFDDLLVENSSRTLRFFWNPSSDTIYVNTAGLYDRSLLFMLKLSDQSVELEKVFNFEGSYGVTAKGWDIAGEYFYVTHILEKENSKPGTGAMSITKSEFKKIDSLGNVTAAVMEPGLEFTQE